MSSSVPEFRRLRASLRGTVRGPLAAVLAALALAPMAALPATAFELFGVRLWGEEKPVVADPVRYTVTLDLEQVDADIRSDIEDRSGLKADEDRPVSGSLGVLSKARNERELLVAALYEEARYDGVVEVSIDGRPLDSLEPDATFDTSRPVPITVRVVSGPRFVLGDVVIAGDTGGIVPAEEGLVAGGDAGSDSIIAAEAAIVRKLKEQGRPLARIAQREIIADHNTRTLDVMLGLEAGPIAAFGDTTVEGTESVDADFTAYMADIERGKTYSPEDIALARERLLALGVFNAVTVQERDALDPDGSLPVDITVTERKHRYFGVGATISSTDGAGVEGYWGHRNLFGRAEKLRIEGGISRIGDANDIKGLDYRAAAFFEKPGVIGPASKFTADIKAASEHPDAYDRFVFSTGAGVTYELTRRQTVSGQLRFDYADITDALNPDGKEYLLVSTPIEYVYDARDNKLNPTSGFRLLAFAEPTHEFLAGATFVKVRGEASAYKSFTGSNRVVLAGRVAAGSIVGASLADIPADRRFYSGGGGSVRGYAYQAIGPRVADANNPGEFIPTGGRSYAEASVELRFNINDTFGIVPFIDAGSVTAGAVPDFAEVQMGAGIGIRYNTPFGPLRIDAAVPLNPRPGDASFGIYAGIGQSF